jgi:hypothetical protein
MRVVTSAPQNSGNPVAGIGRVEVEVDHRLSVVQSVMTDLHGSQSAQAGYPNYDSIEAVIRYMREPVRHLIGDEMKHYSEEERRREAGPEQHDERWIVNRQQKRKDVPRQHHLA